MKTPWSIATTLRNPERIKKFLSVLPQIENFEWNYENQKKYQILLIQNRLYGYASSQFYKDLPDNIVKLIDDLSYEISFEQATEIFNIKNYEDPPMRGRQSINPLKKMGLISIADGVIKITDLGRLFLEDIPDFGEIFFRSFLKWQIPSLGIRVDVAKEDNNIKPFVGTLHLINMVNKKEIARGNEPKGISKKEFSLFVPTLVHYKDINIYAEKIIVLRDRLYGKTKHEQQRIFSAYEMNFAAKFSETKDQNIINKLLNNLRDYGDNAIRYFRLTRYIYIRGGGFYVDLDPRRYIEINALLSHDNAQPELFESEEEYLSYISDISRPELPWETTEKLMLIVQQLAKEIKDYEKKLRKKHRTIKETREMVCNDLKDYISELRAYRQQLQEEKNSKIYQTSPKIESCISIFRNIFDYDDRAVLLEKISALGLHALNDALKVKPNYPVGDDNNPTFTAPANTPDIECFYESFNVICEVTMLTNRNQWYYEGQPIMRHLRDFEKKYDDKPSYCLFIAPKLHRDTVNTFWMSIKYEYEGQKQKIIPLSISNFILILEALHEMKVKSKFLRHTDILHLYDEIIATSASFDQPKKWLDSISETIYLWKRNLIS